MALLGRPIGVWIAMAYLLGLLALAVFWALTAPIVPIAFSVLLLCLSVVLLSSLNRWAVLATAALAAMQVGSYLSANSSPVPEPLGSANTIVVSIQYNLVPLVFLAATIAVALYTAWIWRRGVLK